VKTWHLVGPTRPLRRPEGADGSASQAPERLGRLRRWYEEILQFPAVVSAEVPRGTRLACLGCRRGRGRGCRRTCSRHLRAAAPREGGCGEHRRWPLPPPGLSPGGRRRATETLPGRRRNLSTLATLRPAASTALQFLTSQCDPQGRMPTGPRASDGAIGLDAAAPAAPGAVGPPPGVAEGGSTMALEALGSAPGARPTPQPLRAPGLEAARDGGVLTPPAPGTTGFARPLPRVMAVANQKGGRRQDDHRPSTSGPASPPSGTGCSSATSTPQGNASTGSGSTLGRCRPRCTT
jgi:hypothetical protein